MLTKRFRFSGFLVYRAVQDSFYNENMGHLSLTRFSHFRMNHCRLKNSYQNFCERNELYGEGQKQAKEKMNWGLGLLALPGVLFLLAFSYAPLFGLIIPFKNIDYAKGIFNSDWAGFDNFKFFFSSQDAWRITRNTVLLNFMFIAVTLFLAVVFSLALFELGRRQVKLYQTCTFVPYFVSWVVASYILYAFLSPDMGVIPNMLESMGMDIPNFYNSPEYWPGILLFSYVWKNIGYMMLLFYATLMGIDTTQFEAAAIDGANKFQIVMKISIPFLVPTIILMALLQIGKIFYADFGMFYFLTKDSGMTTFLVM